MSNSSGSHLLVFPYPAQGHMLPLLDLTHQLVIRGVTITILVTPKNLPLLRPLLSKHPSIQTLILPFPHHPSIPPGVENVKDLPAKYFRPMMRAMGDLYHPLLHWFQSDPSPPTAILSDFFLGWTHHLASHLGIPRIVFSPSGAITLACSACMWRDLPKRQDPNDDSALISFPNVPNSQIYPWYQLSPIYRSYREGDPDSEFIRDGMLANLASWGFVFNSFNELESVYLEHFRKDLGHPRVWAVGPLLPPQNDGPTTERGGTITVEASDVFSWLDTCPDNSVVYVCFGSQAMLKNKQMEELAFGLERSGVRFLWSIKDLTIGHVAEEYGMIPVGFEDRVAGRGLVIRGWAPQVSILGHRAVGAFLTHCGWNSVLESMVAGVPMLAWPMGADQYINARLLIDEAGVATEICEGRETIPNADELARIISKSVSANGSERVRAVELSEAALGAVKEGGGSFKDLDGLVTALCDLNLADKRKG